MHKYYKHILLTITLLALGVIYFVFDPSASRIFHKCPVMSLTGLPCAGCGSQRAIHALLHLDFAEAIRYNFLVIAILPFLGLPIFSSFFRKQFPKLYLTTHHAYVAYSIFAIIMLWWVLRIVFGWYVWSVNPTQYIYSREILLQPHQARNLYQP